MYTKHFTLADVASMLSRIVARVGSDHIAVRDNGKIGCVYAEVQNGSLVPVCIVGQFFADLGALAVLVREAPDFGLSGSEPEQYGTCINVDLWADAERIGFTFDEDAKEYLSAAQRMQDRGKSWGTALVYAQDRALWFATASVRNALGMEYQYEPDRYDEKYDNLG
jgi:hypothetical protein